MDFVDWKSIKRIMWHLKATNTTKDYLFVYYIRPEQKDYTLALSISWDKFGC